MPIETAQAMAIPSFRTRGDMLNALSRAQKLNIQPPRIVTADGEVFDDSNGFAVRYLQNCATTSLKVKLGSEGIKGADDFHFILVGGSAQDDGLGSGIDLSKYVGKVYIKAASGNPRVATFIAYHADAQPH